MKQNEPNENLAMISFITGIVTIIVLLVITAII